MTEIEKKQERIRTFDFILNHLCLSELPEIGRKAIIRLRNQLTEEIKNETRNLKDKTPSSSRQ
jgi:hypothetical protein